MVGQIVPTTFISAPMGGHRSLQVETVHDVVKRRKVPANTIEETMAMYFLRFLFFLKSGK